jgi:hypothetical protein
MKIIYSISLVMIGFILLSVFFVEIEETSSKIYLLTNFICWGIVYMYSDKKLKNNNNQ